MIFNLHKAKFSSPGNPILISGSKSESNRVLLLQAIYPNITIENLSNSEDSLVMQNALTSKQNTIDIHHAGTAMRFLTAYFAFQPNREVILTGSERMQERPIQILVDALRHLGADIAYLRNEGFPPLKIKGIAPTQNKVELEANISSQYISALMLVAPSLPDGLEINLKDAITSLPYIKMTLQLLNAIGIEGSFSDNVIKIKPKASVDDHQFMIESDWSSASYLYSIMAMSDLGATLELEHFKQSSLQGDSILTEIYKNLGVETTFTSKGIQLKKIHNNPQNIILNLKNSPDLAQTIAVSCFGLGLECQLSGLHTLPIKETNRLMALKTELEKLGAEVTIADSSLHLKPSRKINSDIRINTYQDHRMAMAFAPLALRVPLQIEDPMVVAKSYLTFWNDLQAIGFKISEY